ncbi:MAG TPA: hypothetical protein VFF13_03470 [archaeon]|nr:hypothetical protein [archaeon]
MKYWPLNERSKRNRRQKQIGVTSQAGTFKLFPFEYDQIKNKEELEIVKTETFSGKEELLPDLYAVRDRRKTMKKKGKYFWFEDNPDRRKPKTKKKNQ